MKLFYIPESELKRIRESEKALCNYYLYSSLIAEVSDFNCLYMASRAGLEHVWRPFGSKNIVSWLFTNGMKNPNESIAGELCDLYFSSSGHDYLFLHSLLVLQGKLKFDSIHTRVPVKEEIFGSGISRAVDIISARRTQKQLGRVYVLLEDRDLFFERVWRSVQRVSNEKMSELTIIVDHAPYNLELNLRDICLKFRVFGLMAQECNGHNFQAIDEALASLRNNNNGKPQVLVTNMIRKKFGRVGYEKLVERFKVRIEYLTRFAGLGKLAFESVEI